MQTNTYIFENELNSNIQVIIQAHTENDAWEMLSIVVKEICDFKLKCLSI